MTVQTPPEKARLVRGGGNWQTLKMLGVDRLFDTQWEFRRVPNLFEIVSWDYWQKNFGHALTEPLAARKRAGEDITAVFMANDQMALGLLAALHEEGLEAPWDVSVVGFDDLPEAPYLTPPLTTVRQDFAELGRRAVELVLARLAGQELRLQPVPPVLLTRASSGPVPVGRTPARV